MRKKTMRMMIVAGAVALLLPTAAMAEWDQSETHNNQDDHDAMVNVATAGGIHPAGDFAYDMESPVGYDAFGAGTATLATNDPFAKRNSAPWNTTPCPIQLADPMMPMWDEAMGNCPTQTHTAGWKPGQTDMGWGEGDNEMFGPILDDLYQSLSETAYTNSNENGEPAFKKVDQVLDILFYRGNTVGEVYGLDGWTDATGTQWYGGLGIDQTLDQDVADISGSTFDGGNNLGTAHGTWLWNYDHLAQTFYQDFRLFDFGNTFGGIGTSTTVDLETAGKPLKGEYNPRTRHGIELLAVCAGGGASCTSDGYDTESGWGVKSMDEEDFAFFDQWVIQSLRDTYTQEYDGGGLQTFYGSVALNQSYSSWMAVGVPGQLCDSINDNPSGTNTCVYEYEKDGHSVNKSIAPNSSTHQTGDP